MSRRSRRRLKSLTSTTAIAKSMHDGQQALHALEEMQLALRCLSSMVVHAFHVPPPATSDRPPFGAAHYFLLIHLIEAGLAQLTNLTKLN